MKFYLGYLKDSVGNNYLGISVPSFISNEHLETLKGLLSEDEFEIYTSNQQSRDHGSHHITVINVMDYNNLCRKYGISDFVNSLDPVFKYEIDDIQFLGVGTANRNENRAYFIVCRSEKLKAIREKYGLPEQDFHVTLGFKWKDVFGVRKNEVLEKKSNFLKLLKQEFYKKENFDFIRKVEGFDENPELEIIPISISDTYLKILCGDYIMDIGLMDGTNNFQVFTRYKNEKDVKRIPMTEILKILKIN